MLAWLRSRYPRTVQGHSTGTLRALRDAVAGRFPERGHDLTFLRHRALKDLFAAAGHDEALADEALEVFFAERNRVEFYGDVRPALQRLRSRYRLFALSNGNADLARCGIADLFDGHVTARSAGAAKPDARIFAALLHEAGVAAAQVLHNRRRSPRRCRRRLARRFADRVAQPRRARVARGICASVAHHLDACGNFLAPRRCMRRLAAYGIDC